MGDDGYLQVSELTAWQIVKGIQEQQLQIDKLSLNETGDIILTGNSPDTYTVSTPTGITDRIGAFASATIAKIEAGYGSFKELVALRSTINNLQTSIISPLSPDQPIIISRAQSTIHDLPSTSVDPLLIVDGELVTTTISARVALLTDIQAVNATISGTLYANKITSPDLDNLRSTIYDLQSTISAGISDTELTSITDRIKARLALLSGNEPTAADIPVPEATPSTSLSSTIYDLPSTISTSSASIDFVTINNYLAVIGSATITDLDITNHLYTESISSKTGLLALGGNTLLVDSSGAVTVNGDLKVTGTLIASELNLGRLNVFNEAGETVATIDASGSANLATLATQMITIASPAIASASAGLSELIGTTTSNATAGESVLISPNTELTIESLYVTPNSLVYLTPTTNTDNKVLFVKSKESCVPTTNYQLPTTNCKASFTVAIDAPASSDISFNWWIIQLQ